MASDDATNRRMVRVPRAANDNWIAVADNLPDALVVEDWEIELLEAHMPDSLAGMIAANDNDQGTES
jgi:hypothetical protein